MPFIGPLARKSGNTLATDADTLRLLEGGELLGVFPEGYKGVGKAFKDRYRLQRFGRGGFIEVALRTKTPIIPVSHRRVRGDLPDDLQLPGAGAGRRLPVLPDHADCSRGWARSG